jgi:hypothetical protein
MDQTALESLEDKDGAVAIGWLADDVLFSRFSGALGGELGARCASRLDALLGLVPAVHYFADSSALKQYDLLARSAFVRVLMANRRKFRSLVVLTWAEGLSPASKAFVTALGEPTQVLADPADFHARLIRVAPLAKQRLNPKTWVRSTADPR